MARRRRRRKLSQATKRKRCYQRIWNDKTSTSSTYCQAVLGCNVKGLDKLQRAQCMDNKRLAWARKGTRIRLKAPTGGYNWGALTKKEQWLAGTVNGLAFLKGVGGYAGK